MRFLIEQVWKIDRPVNVLDCGCGYGFLGMLIMPFLPKGSACTGIDPAEKRIISGQKEMIMSCISSEIMFIRFAILLKGTDGEPAFFLAFIGWTAVKVPTAPAAPPEP